MGYDVVTLNSALADALGAYMREHDWPDAKAVPVQGGYGIDVSDGRFVIVEPTNLQQEGVDIILAIVSKAKKGDIKAAEWLDERGIIPLPGKGEAEA